MANHKKKKKNSVGVLVYATMMLLFTEQLLIVSMQQLACKLCGCDPVKQFATCPITAMLTYLY